MATNPQGLTTEEMGALAEKQMQDRVVAQSMSNPNTLVTGGVTPAGQFQAMTQTQNPALAEGQAWLAEQAKREAENAKALANQRAELAKLDKTSPYSQPVGTPVPQNAATLTADVGAADARELDATLSTRQAELEAEKQQRIDALRQQQKEEEDYIRQTFSARRSELGEQQGEQQKTQDVLAYRLGRKDTPYGVAEMAKLKNDQARVMNELGIEENRLVLQSRAALKKGEFDVAQQLRDEADRMLQRKIQQEELAFRKQSQVMEEQKFAMSYGKDVFSAAAKAGFEPSQEMFTWFDDKYNNGNAGLGELLYKASYAEQEKLNKQQEIKDALDKISVQKGVLDLENAPLERQRLQAQVDAAQRDLKTRDIEDMGKLFSAIKDAPTGVSFSIGDASYFGVDGNAVIEKDKSGMGRITYKDPATGKQQVKQLGYLGDMDDLQLTYVDGVPTYINKLTNAVIPITHGQGAAAADAGWDRFFPDGSVGGQCGEFCHSIVSDYPYGLNTLEQKRSVINVPKTEKPMIGDLLIEGYGSTGHISAVNWVGKDDQGNTVVRVTESNFKGDGKVTNYRPVRVDNPKVEGFFRGTLRKELKTGTDAPTPAPAPQPAVEPVPVPAEQIKPKSPSPFITGRMTEAQYQAAVQKEQRATQAAQNLIDGGYASITSLEADIRDRALTIAKENGYKLAGNSNFQKMSDAARNEFRDLLSISSLIGSLEGIKSGATDYNNKSVDTGPIAAFWQGSLGKFNAADQSFLDLQAKTENLRSQIMKQRSGAAVAEQEVSRLAKFIPLTSDNDQQYNTKLNSLKEEYNKLVETQAKLYGFKDTNEFMKAFGLAGASVPTSDASSLRQKYNY